MFFRRSENLVSWKLPASKRPVTAVVNQLLLPVTTRDKTNKLRCFTTQGGAPPVMFVGL